MGSTLTFTLGLVSRPLVTGLNVGQAAVTAFGRTARTMASGASAAFSTITSSVRSSITALHEVGGAVQTVQAALSGLLGPVKLAAQIETARVQFRVLIGDLNKADEIFARLNKLADDNPNLDLAPIARGAAMLAGTNIEKSGIPDFLAQIGNASGDGEKFLQMVTAATQVLGKGGKLQGDELQQFAEAGIQGLQEEMGKVLDVTAEELVDLQTQGQLTFDTLSEAIRNLTTGTGRYAGMAESAARTTEGKWNAVTTAVQQAQRAFGEQILIPLSPILDQALKLAQGLLPWAKRAGEAVKEIAIFLLAAFKSNQLGPLIWESLKLAGLSFLDLLGRGFIALGEKLKEVTSEAILSIGDKVTMLLPAYMTDADKRRDAEERETARKNGTYKAPETKSLREHFDQAKSGMEQPIRRLSTSVAGRYSAVQPYAQSIKEDIEYANSQAGQSQVRPLGQIIKTVPDTRKEWDGILPTPQLYPEKPEPSPWLKRPWRPTEWQGPLPEGVAYKDVMADYVAAARQTAPPPAPGRPSAFPGLDRLREMQRGSLGGSRRFTPATGSVAAAPAAAGGQPSANMPGMDLSGIGSASTDDAAGADPASDPYGDKGRKNSEYSRAEKTLISGFSRQAKGRGRKTWDQWLNSGVRTAGVDPARLSAMRGMDPEALSKVATNRPNRTRQEREKHAADMRQKQQGQGGDIGTAVRGIGGDVRQIKDHLSKLQVK